MTPEEFWKQLQDKGTANTNFKPLEWIFRFAEKYHKEQLTIPVVVSTSNCDFCSSEIGSIKNICHVCVDEMQDRD